MILILIKDIIKCLQHKDHRREIRLILPKMLNEIKSLLDKILELNNQIPRCLVILILQVKEILNANYRIREHVGFFFDFSLHTFIILKQFLKLYPIIK